MTSSSASSRWPVHHSLGLRSTPLLWLQQSWDSQLRSSRLCHLCLAADHSWEECALASLEPHRPTAVSQVSTCLASSSRNARRPAPYRSSGYCYCYNNGNCPVHHAALSMCARVVLSLVTQRCGAQRPKQREGTGLLKPGHQGHHSSPPRLQKNQGRNLSPGLEQGVSLTQLDSTYGSILCYHTH